MHHRMPPPKTGWPSLNMVIFPPVMHLVLDDPKHWPPWRLLIKFTSYSCKTAGFWLNQQLINWASHVSGLGPSFMRIWTWGSSLRSGSRNASTRNKNDNSASRLSKFGIFSVRSKQFPVATGDHGWNLVITLGPRDKATINGLVAEQLTLPQKILGEKIRWKSSCLDFLGILLTDYFPKGQTINATYYSSLLVQFEDILKEKCCRKVTKGVLFLHDNAPAHQALATQKKLTYLRFQCLEFYIWVSVHHKSIIYNKPRRCSSVSIVFINNYKYALHVTDTLCVHHQEHYKL